MDALKIEDRARALLDQHGDGAEAFVRQHLDAAEEVGLEGAVRDWKGVMDALTHLRGGLPG